MNTPNGTLFVVDDAESACRGVAALALSLDIPCETFASAEAFLDRYDPSRPGCLLVDQRLTGISGLELLARLTALGSPLPFILVSAYASVSMAVQAMQNGAVTVLQKPYEADALRDAVRKSLAIDADRRAVAHRRRDVLDRMASLTPRESRVMEMLVAGEPHKIIARRLGVSLRTAARLCASVLDRMGVDSAMGLIHRLTGTPSPASLTGSAGRGQADPTAPAFSIRPPAPGGILRTEAASPIGPPFHQGHVGQLSE